MRKRIEFKWEKLDEFTFRAQVIGGWLVLHEIVTPKGNTSCCMEFVPDQSHEWSILPRPDNTPKEKIDPANFVSKL